MLFQIATGKGPWREIASADGAPLTPEEKKTIAYLKSVKGKIPVVPQRTLELKDPYINVLLKAMEWCYQFRPEDRPSAREVAGFLEKWRKRIDAAILDE